MEKNVDGTKQAGRSKLWRDRQPHRGFSAGRSFLRQFVHIVSGIRARTAHDRIFRNAHPQHELGGRCTLILTRRVGETIYIDGTITVTVLGIKGNQTRIGVNAPRDIAVHREEVFDRIRNEGAVERQVAFVKSK